MDYDPMLDVRLREDLLFLKYGPGVFGPELEFRRLAEIRPSLLYFLHSAHLGCEFPAISALPSGICASSFASEVRCW